LNGSLVLPSGGEEILGVAGEFNTSHVLRVASVFARLMFF